MVAEKGSAEALDWAAVAETAKGLGSGTVMGSPTGLATAATVTGWS